jgi:hypothetical protein
MKERSKHVLGAEVMSICSGKSYRIEELTKKIYNNLDAKNIVRVYQCVEVLLYHDILIPEFKQRYLRFRLNKEKWGLKNE